MFFRKDEFDGPNGNPIADNLIVRVRRQPLRQLALVALPLLAVVGLAYWLLGGPRQPAAAMPPAEIAVAFPLQRNIVEYEEFNGRVEPSRSVEIRPRV